MFDKIITISINPALDVTLWTETMDFSEPNKTSREEIYAAGKSINVSRVLASLQTPSTSLGICGDDNSKLFTTLLQKDGVRFDYLTIPGCIRENLTLIIPDGRVLKINRAGFPVPADAMKQLKTRIEAEMDGCSSVLLVFAGSLPPNITPEAYKSYILSFRRAGVSFALDTAVFKMQDIEKMRPFIIKPNLVEFRQMCGSDLRTEQSIIKLSRTLSTYVDHVLVSLGSKGLIYVTKNCGYRLSTPTVRVKSTIGAGDTTLAGFIHSLQEGKAPQEAITYAIAAGSASVMLDGTDIVTPKQVEEQIPNVTVKSIR